MKTILIKNFIVMTRGEGYNFMKTKQNPEAMSCCIAWGQTYECASEYV